MIVKCDKCSKTYQVDDNLIKSEGTKFRCVNCQQIFEVFPPPPPEPIAEPRAAESSPFEDDDTVTVVDYSEEVFDQFQKTEDRYTELGPIGEGGMGEVKLARDTQLLRKVAIKSLKKEAAASPAALSFFIREAQITAQLDHPNIVPLYTVKEPDKNERDISFVMKLVKGQTLTEIIHKARTIYKKNPKAMLPPELTLESRLGYFLKACDGMIYAHRKEVIHRDLKPSNIMVGDYGEVYVMDWGIAKMTKEIPETLFGIQKMAARKAGLHIDGAESGNIVGTPGYISPEQLGGDPDVGPLSDQFSMGIMLYELVTLRPARPGNLVKKLEWASKGLINQLAHLLPEKKIDPELKAIVLKATAPKRDDRYISVAAMAEDIRCYLRKEEVMVMPDNTMRKLWRWMNKHRQLAAICLLCFLLLTSAMTIGTLFRERGAMKSARIREKKLTHLLTKVATQAHYIDTRFIRLEGLLANLAENAMYLIRHGKENDERLYWYSDYQSPETAPPDLAPSKLYGQPVSIEYPVVKLAPGVQRESVADLMQRLAPMRHHFRKLLLDSRNSYAPLSEEEAKRLLTEYGVSVSWVYLGLEAGVMYSFPGKGRYPDDYDPRKRPWYRLGANKHSVLWGIPYIDVQGLGMVLPCATSLYDIDGRFFGVAGMDVTYNNIIEESLRRQGAVGVVDSYLLDDKGRIVISSGLMDASLAEYKSDSTLRLELFPVQEVVERIRRNESGLAEVEREGEPRIIFFHEVPSLGWFYAEEIRSVAVLGPDAD